MIDLRNKYVLIRTQEEYEKILEEAKKQGFKWNCGDIVIPFDSVMLPDVLKFYNDKTMILQETPLVEADALLGTKEMTARELIDFIVKCRKKCDMKLCSECVLDRENNKSKKSLCCTSHWEICKEELISIAKSGKTTIKSQKEMILESFQDFLDNPEDNPAITSDFIESLQIVVDKLKEQER